MGDIKKIKKKYEKPKHPWHKTRIDQERKYRKNYGLTNKKELWKCDSVLKNFKHQIKSFRSMKPEQAAKESEKLRQKLRRMGIIKEETVLDEVLGYETDVIFNRRLQTFVHKKGLARTPKQARQFITHEHVSVGGRTINSPGYLVLAEEEGTITFHHKSPFISEIHPERKQPEMEKHKKIVKEEKKAEEPEVVKLKEEDINE